MENTTICACATGTGGAISIIRVSGVEAIPIVRKISRMKSINSFNKNSCHYGTIIDNNGNDIDDVIVSTYINPNSYTGEDCVEISCHASKYIVSSIIETLISNGCVMAEPGEFTKRAYINGKSDLSKAEAVADLISSSDKKSHDIALKQLRGGVSNELSILREKLLTMTSLLELELDFSEEDVEFANREELLELANTISNKVSSLKNSFKVGNAIKNGINIAIIGAPNVGKSTLLNTILGEDKAIVSNIPGTTRDLVEDTIVYNGITYRFIDTAGIHKTNDYVESIGIERSVKAANKAYIIISMRDDDNDFVEYSPLDDQDIIYITNKTNEFSALNNIGIDKLFEEIESKLGIHNINDNDIIISNMRHYSALCNAENNLESVITGLKMNIPGDLISEHLRECIDNLGTIVGGSFTPNEVLHNIFKNFCIGK